MRKTITTALVLCCYAAQAQQAPLRLSGAETQSAIIIDLSNGAIVTQYAPDRLMTPASTTKLLTTAAALETLGADYRIPTEAFYNSNNSSLTIVGHADPTLGSERFGSHNIATMAQAIAAELNKHTNHIDTLYIDNTAIHGAPCPTRRLWDDMGNYYGAAPQAINIYENTSLVTLRSPRASGQPCSIVSTEPAMEMKCYVKSYSGTADKAYIYGFGEGEWYISGEIPAGRNSFEVKGAIPNPAKVFAQEMTRALDSCGISISGCAVGAPATHGKLLTTAFSPTIAEIIDTTNHKSNNLFADALLLQLAHDNMSWDNGLNALEAFTRKIFTTKKHVFDGSGLSPQTCLSARQLAQLLAYMHKSPNGKRFEQSLPVAGKEGGTLSTLGKGTRIEGKVKAKSGTLMGVIAYAGIATDRNGKQYAFSIIVNKHTEARQTVRNEIVRWLLRNIKF